VDITGLTNIYIANDPLYVDTGLTSIYILNDVLTCEIPYGITVLNPIGITGTILEQNSTAILSGITGIENQLNNLIVGITGTIIEQNSGYILNGITGIENQLNSIINDGITVGITGTIVEVNSCAILSGITGIENQLNSIINDGITVGITGTIVEVNSGAILNGITGIENQINTIINDGLIVGITGMVIEENSTAILSGITAIQSQLSTGVNITNNPNVKLQDGSGNNITSNTVSAGIRALDVNIAKSINTNLYCDGQKITSTANGIQNGVDVNIINSNSLAVSNNVLTNSYNSSNQSLNTTIISASALDITSKTYNGAGTTPITASTVLTKNGLDVNLINGVSISNTSIDTHCYGSTNGTTWHHLKTDANGILNIHSMTQSGVGADITSTLIGAKQCLDVNVGNAVSIKDSSGNSLSAVSSGIPQLRTSIYDGSQNLMGIPSNPFNTNVYSGGTAITKTVVLSQTGLDTNIINSSLTTTNSVLTDSYDSTNTALRANIVASSGLNTTSLSKTYAGNGTTPITATTTGAVNALDVNIASGNITVSSVDIKDSSGNNLSAVSSTVPQLRSSLYDISGTALTSSTALSKTGLDTNIINSSLTTTNSVLTDSYDSTNTALKANIVASTSLTTTNSVLTNSYDSGNTAIRANIVASGGLTTTSLSKTYAGNGTTAITATGTALDINISSGSALIKDSSGNNLSAVSPSLGQLKTTLYTDTGNAFGTTSDPIKTQVVNTSNIPVAMSGLTSSVVIGDGVNNANIKVLSTSDPLLTTYGVVSKSVVCGAVGTSIAPVGMTVGSALKVNVENASIPISGSVSISGTPSVDATIVGTPSVSISGTPSVNATIVGTPTVSTTLSGATSSIQIGNGTTNATITGTIANIKTSNALVCDSALYGLNVSSGDVQPLTTVVNASRNQLETRDNDANTTLSDINTKTIQQYSTTSNQYNQNNSKTGLNVYQIYPRVLQILFNGSNFNNTGNCLLGGPATSLGFESTNYGLPLNTQKYWFGYMASTGLTRSVIYDYIDTNGDLQTATTVLTSNNANIILCGGNVAISIFRWRLTRNMIAGETFYISYGTSSSAPIIGAITGGGEYRNYFNGIITIPNNAIGYITNYTYYSNTNGSLLLCKWDKDAVRNFTYALPASTAGTNSVSAGSDGAIGGLITAGETVAFCRDTATTSSSIYSNLVIRFLS